MSQETKKEFSKLRAFFWPVHGFELKKILPMFFMFFFISFNYTILRDTKDTLVVTSKAGAEAIPFLKFWGVLPSAILFMIVFSKLSNMLSKQNLFYVTLVPFIVFFALFSTLIYPNREAMQLDGLAGMLSNVLPLGAKGFVESVRAWHFSVFYILSELWGSVVLSLLFWGFANDITKVTEAKRFYSLFAIGANLALLVSGEAIARVSDIRRFLPAGVDAWQVSLNYLMLMVAVAGIAVMGFYWWINRNVLTDARFYDQSEVKAAKKSKPKMSIKESMLFLARSPYILCLATLVIAYGISINLVEVTWKKQLGLLYPDQNDYSTFMGRFSQVTGAVTILMALFVGSNAIRKGWGFAAMITPVVLLITGAGFFAFILGRDFFADMIMGLGTTPLFLAVMFGAAQNIMSKSAKYTLFDPTKEMAYIPLDAESKVKGKAAIDVVGARLGKSGGSLVQQALMIILGSTSILSITPYIAVILFGIIAVWIVAVRILDKKFVALTAQKAAEAKAQA